MRVCMVAAIGQDGAMGRDGSLPWHCPQDLRHFRALTMGRVCLMGRKTADSLKKPLRDRVNVVLTRDRTWSKPGFLVVHNRAGIKRILRQYEQQEVWIIGGAGLYQKYMAECQVLHLTILDIAVPDADTWFPLNGLRRFNGAVSSTSVDPKVVYWVLTPDPIPTGNQRPRSPASME